VPHIVSPTVPDTRLRPVTALGWSFVALLAANLGRIPVIASGQHSLPIILNDLALAAVLTFGLIGIVQRRRLALDRITVAVLVFALVGGLTAIAAVPRFGMPVSQLYVSLAYLLRWLFYVGVYVVVINCGTAGDAARLWRALEGVILVFAAFGVLQAALLPGFAQMVQPGAGWDLQGHRLVSTALDPNIAGAMILIVLLVQLAMISTGVPTRRWKPLLLTLAVALTLSRSAVLALVAGGLIILFARGLSRRLVRLGAVVLLAVLATLPLLIRFAAQYGKFSADGSASARLITWALAFRAFLDHPIIGIGFNTWGFYQQRFGFDISGNASYSTDGGLLFVAALTGLVGLSIYLTMIGFLIVRCRRIWRSPAAGPAQRGMAIGAVAATVGVCVDSIFLNSMFAALVMEILWVVWGLTFLAARDVEAPEPAPARNAARSLVVSPSLQTG